MSELLEAAREAYTKEDASIYAKAASKYAPKKLTDKQISEMVSLYKSGKGCTDIGEQFGVSYTTVRKTLIKAGVTIRPQGGSRKRKPKPQPEVRPAPAISGIAMLGRLDCMIQETYGTEAVITSVSGTAEWCELTFTFGGDEYSFGFSRKSCE